MAEQQLLTYERVAALTARYRTARDASDGSGFSLGAITRSAGDFGLTFELEHSLAVDPRSDGKYMNPKRWFAVDDDAGKVVRCG